MITSVIFFILKLYVRLLVNTLRCPQCKAILCRFCVFVLIRIPPFHLNIYQAGLVLGIAESITGMCGVYAGCGLCGGTLRSVGGVTNARVQEGIARGIRTHAVVADDIVVASTARVDECAGLGVLVRNPRGTSIAKGIQASTRSQERVELMCIVVA